MNKLREIAPFIKADAEKQKYSNVDESDSEYDTSNVAQSRHSGRQWHLISLASSFILGIIAMALVATVLGSLSPTPPSNRKIPEFRQGTNEKTGLPLSWSNGDCGNSPEDAVARNCRFSIVLQAWVQRDCLTDEDIEDEKLMYEGRDWPYQLANGTNLTVDALQTGMFDHFTTTFEWHVVHCMYIWKRVHRAMLDPNRKLDSYAGNIHHTNHCVKMIGGHAGGMKDSGTKIFVKYPLCA